MEPIIIKTVRCSFPQLYGSVERGDSTFNPGITLLLSKTKHAGVIEELKEGLKKTIAENPKLRKQPPKGEKLCLRGPDSEGWRDEYPDNHLLLKAGNPKPPVVLHKDMTRMTEADNKIYSGCYVNVKVELWGQANQWGRRVNAKLIAVQFVDDGESFDGSYVSEEEARAGFGSIDEDAEVAGDDFLN